MGRNTAAGGWPAAVEKAVLKLAEEVGDLSNEDDHHGGGNDELEADVEEGLGLELSADRKSVV